jgi:hypothetical protein
MPPATPSPSPAPPRGEWYRHRLHHAPRSLTHVQKRLGWLRAQLGAEIGTNRAFSAPEAEMARIRPRTAGAGTVSAHGGGHQLR